MEFKDILESQNQEILNHSKEAFSKLEKNISLKLFGEFLLDENSDKIYSKEVLVKNNFQLDNLSDSNQLILGNFEKSSYIVRITNPVVPKNFRHYVLYLK